MEQRNVNTSSTEHSVEPLVTQNLVMFPDNKQLSFSGRVRNKSQITIDTNIIKLYEIEHGDTVVCKIIGVKKQIKND